MFKGRLLKNEATSASEIELLKQSWAHYKHLEVLRKDHLNLFIVLNGAIGAFAGVGSSSGIQAGALNYLPLFVLFLSVLATVFYFISSLNEESRRSHYSLMDAIIQSTSANRVWNEKFLGSLSAARSCTARLLDNCGLYNMTKLMLIPYVMLLIVYAFYSVTLVHRTDFHLGIIVIPFIKLGGGFEWGALFSSWFGLLLCSIDFVQTWLRRDRNRD